MEENMSDLEHIEFLDEMLRRGGNLQEKVNTYIQYLKYTDAYEKTGTTFKELFSSNSLNRVLNGESTFLREYARLNSNGRASRKHNSGSVQSYGASSSSSSQSCGSSSSSTCGSSSSSSSCGSSRVSSSCGSSSSRGASSSCGSSISSGC